MALIGSNVKKSDIQKPLACRA